MSDPVNRVLERLESVVPTGPDSWKACCPAHDSKSRSSLSISKGDNGRVLIHCFGGCEQTAIVDALGLTMRDLMLNDDWKPSSNGRTSNGAARVNGHSNGKPKPAPKVYDSPKAAIASTEAKFGPGRKSGAIKTLTVGTWARSTVEI